MSYRLEIVAQTVEEIDAQIKALVDVIRPAMNLNPQPVEIAVLLDKLSLEDLHDLMRKRFDPEGYEVTIVDRDPDRHGAKTEGVKTEGVDTKAKNGTAAVKRSGRPGRLDPAQAKRELAGESKPEPEPEPEGEVAVDVKHNPEADKETVIKRLLEMFANPKLKPKAKAFTDKVSKANGNKPVRDLSASKFAQILKDLEDEFGSL